MGRNVVATDERWVIDDVYTLYPFSWDVRWGCQFDEDSLIPRLLLAGGSINVAVGAIPSALTPGLHEVKFMVNALVAWRGKIHVAKSENTLGSRIVSWPLSSCLELPMRQPYTLNKARRAGVLDNFVTNVAKFSSDTGITANVVRDTSLLQVGRYIFRGPARQYVDDMALWAGAWPVSIDNGPDDITDEVSLIMNSALSLQTVYDLPRPAIRMAASSRAVTSQRATGLRATLISQALTISDEKTLADSDVITVLTDNEEQWVLLDVDGSPLVFWDDINVLNAQGIEAMGTIVSDVRPFTPQGEEAERLLRESVYAYARFAVAGQPYTVQAKGRTGTLSSIKTRFVRSGSDVARDSINIKPWFFKDDTVAQDNAAAFVSYLGGERTIVYADYPLQQPAGQLANLLAASPGRVANIYTADLLRKCLVARVRMYGANTKKTRLQITGVQFEHSALPPEIRPVPVTPLIPPVPPVPPTPPEPPLSSFSITTTHLRDLAVFEQAGSHARVPARSFDISTTHLRDLVIY